MQNWATLSILNTDDGYLFVYNPPYISSSTLPLQVFREKVSLNSRDKSNLEDAVELAAKLLTESALSLNQASQLEHELVPLCQRLYRQILPKIIQDAIKILPPHIPLLLFTDDTWFPWELMHDGSEFLALQRPISRYFVSDKIPSDTGRKVSTQRAVLIIANPTDDLPATIDEAEYLHELFRAESEQIEVKILAHKRATVAQVQTELSRGIYQIIHYTGHAQPGALVLHDGLLKGESIEKAMIEGSFVFLNGCQSTKTQKSTNNIYEEDIIDDLAKSFLTGGALSVLGTVWKIREESGLQSAKTFYEQLLSGRSVGESLLNTRLFVRDKYPSDSIWAAYVAYGIPTQEISLAPNMRQNVAILCIQIIENTFENSINVKTLVFEQLIAFITKVAQKYGGVIQSMASNQIVIRFGTSMAVETDIEKAMWTAFDIKRQINTFRFQPEADNTNIFHVAMSIASGEVSLTTITPPWSQQKQYLTLGRVMQDALWLAEQALPGQILVKEPVKVVGDNIFKFQMQPISRDDTLVEVYSLISNQLTGYNRLRSTPSIPMVGRQTELDKLKALWAESIQGHGKIAWVTGEAGIGKSRLLEAFHASINPQQGKEILIRSLPYAQENPYALLKQLVSTLVSDNADNLQNYQSLSTALANENFNIKKIQILLDIFLPENTPQTRQSTSFSLTQEYQQLNETQLAAAIRYLFEVRTQQTPLCIIFEDVHQADSSSIVVLEKAMRWLIQLPILFIFVSRAEFKLPWVSQIQTDILQLKALSSSDTKTLLEEILQVEELSANLAEKLTKKVKGNPFFLRELVSVLQENQALIKHNNHWKLSTNNAQFPGTMQRAVESQLDTLSTTMRQILQAATVIGSSIDVENIGLVLKRQIDAATIELALDELEALDFIFLADYHQQNYSFVHPLKREIIYERIPLTTRQTYHRRLAEAGINSEHENINLIAQHLYFSVSGTSNKDALIKADEIIRAITYLIKVAKNAQEQYANLEAVTSYRRAIELLNQYQNICEIRLADLYQALGDAENMLGNFEQARQTYENAFRLLRSGIMTPAERRQAADIARSIGRTLMWSSKYDLALEWMNEGKYSLGQHNTLEDYACLALLNIHTGAIYYLRGDFVESQRYYQKGLRLAEKANDRAALAEAHNGIGVIFDVQGKSQLALEHYQHSYRLYKNLDDLYHMATVGENIGTAKFYLGEWNEVIQWDPSKFWRDIGDQNKLAYSAINLGMLYLYRGQWDEADALFSEALQLSEIAENHRIVAVAYNNIGLLRLAQGEIEEGRTHLNHSLALFRKHDIEDRPAEVYCGLAEAALLAGDTKETIKMGKLALISAREQELSTEECIALRLIASAYQMQTNVKEAEQLLKQSLDIATKFKFAFEIGRTKLEFAKLYQKTQREIDAREYLAQAIIIFEQLEAEPLLKQAKVLKEVLL